MKYDTLINPITDVMHARRSIGKLILPMPSDDELAHVLRAAVTAPDHMQLKPWRLTVMTGDALVAFGRALLQSGEEASKEPLDDTAKQKLLNMPLRAPMIITVATDIKKHEKVPSFEQLLSTGALVQNMLLAFESLGYRTVWRTGPLCNEPAVKAYFKVADKDMICGFVYVGSSDIKVPAREAIDFDELTEFRH
ncbi:nitroreductase [Moraxella haemolytica]|uniref:nitroreductase family protein n=1 Tax=Moraxella haemolytica TaxID=2904119 RepID=UPI002543A5C7|nr:nitroreductase [Moraxella sp. ZY171148]WII94412.1 nitroreductase [Moraxella sp. ZY171148]